MLGNLYFVIGIVLILISLFFSIQFFRERCLWGRARYMGIPASVFVWMTIIYHLALFEGVYGVVGFILDLPIWIDIFLFLVILGLSMTVYFMLIHREKFKPTLFMTAFLVPLSIPGLHTAAKLIPSKAPAILQSVPVGVPAKARSIFPQKQRVGNSGYEVEFPDSHSKGTFGDWLTAAWLTARGYKKLDSKLDKIHGIDGVYLRYEKDNPKKIQEILLVETKVGKARINRQTEQMTDGWSNDKVDKMRASENNKIRETGELIHANPGLVRKELWHHDLNNGNTTIYRLDSEAKMVSGTKQAEHYISNLVRKRCESQNPTIVCHSAGQ